MNMYRYSWNLLHSPCGQHGQVMHNPLYESHVLHLRNMIDFFNMPHRVFDDDIYISKVLVNCDGYSVPVEDRFRKMINKSAQHLTTYRAEALDKDYLSQEINKIYPIICERIERFEKDIQNPDNLQEKSREDYEKMLGNGA